VLFTVTSYFASSLLAVLAYIIIGVQHTIFGASEALLVAFAIIQMIQYPFLTQLGDASLEMVMPHILPTFSGLILVSPGVKSCQCCCCATTESSSTAWRHRLYARANDDSLAYFVQLIRFVYSAVAVLIYALANKYENVAVGYGILISFSALMAYSSFTLWYVLFLPALGTWYL
jgi:hypothetical protein